MLGRPGTRLTEARARRRLLQKLFSSDSAVVLESEAGLDMAKAARTRRCGGGFEGGKAIRYTAILTWLEPINEGRQRGDGPQVVDAALRSRRLPTRNAADARSRRIDRPVGGER